MREWTPQVRVGVRGRFLVQLFSSRPVVQLQVRFDSLVVGEVNGTELRDLAGLYFSVPRVPGNYNLYFTAKDDLGCVTSTTASRVVSVVE